VAVVDNSGNGDGDGGGDDGGDSGGGGFGVDRGERMKWGEVQDHGATEKYG
jgi:hypothetical protein